MHSILEIGLSTQERALQIGAYHKHVLAVFPLAMTRPTSHEWHTWSSSNVTLRDFWSLQTWFDAPSATPSYQNLIHSCTPARYFLIRGGSGNSGDVHVWIIASQVIVIGVWAEGDGLAERRRLGTSWPGRIRVMSLPNYHSELLLF